MECYDLVVKMTDTQGLHARLTRSKAIIISFESYRGGVGKTTAAYNVGALMAASGSRVLLVDLDLERHGLTSLVEANAAHAGRTFWWGGTPVELPDGAKIWNQGTVVQLLMEYHSGDKFTATALPENTYKWEPPTDFIAPDSKGTMNILPVTTQSSYAPHQRNLEELAHLQRLDEKFLEGGMGRLAKDLREALTQLPYDYVILDYSHGHIIGPEVASNIADHVVLFSGLSDQHISGTAGKVYTTLTILRERETTEGKGNNGRKIIPVLGIVPPYNCAERQQRVSQLDDRIVAVTGGSPDFPRVFSGAEVLEYDPAVALGTIRLAVADSYCMNMPLARGYRALHERIVRECGNEAMTDRAGELTGGITSPR